MNPLQELQAIIEGLLFRMGDEQMDIPLSANLSLVMADGRQSMYTVYATKNGEGLTVTEDIDFGEDED